MLLACGELVPRSSAMRLWSFRLSLPGALLLVVTLFHQEAAATETAERCASFPCQNGATCENVGDDYICHCANEGVLYTGKNCHELYDACATVACANCTSTRGTKMYSCNCPVGYSGDSCQDLVGICTRDPCLHNGTCIENDSTAFQCVCPPGFRGRLCEEDVNECLSEPCKNGAICMDGPGTYYCFCVPGYQGNNCEIDINECASRPCENNSTCVNGKDRYECRCVRGFSGINCEVEINECESRPCQNGATCSDFVGFYTCECPPGYDSLNCEIDINECASQPCRNGGICNDLVNSYKCDCSGTGYIGPTCQQEILECASSPCQNSATCQEEVNGYICLCWPGYEGTHCQVDVDECAVEPCQNGATCLERSDTSSYRSPTEFSYAHAAGYMCVCLPGFTGENCSVDVDDCEHLPCENGGTCEDLTNAYQCVCQPGFTGVNCEVNIDECESQPCKNGGRCQDGDNAYTCLCPEAEPDEIPWGGRHCEVLLIGCVDHRCENGATCMPWFEGGKHGYECFCPPGFYNQHCSEPTTFSFSSAQNFVPLHLASRETGIGLYQVRLRFRTTLPTGILIYSGDTENALVLELLGGMLFANVYEKSTEQPLAWLNQSVSDGRWHDVRVSVTDTLVLELLDEECFNSSCRTQSGHFSIHTTHSFTGFFVGGVGEDLINLTISMKGFVGCVEDLSVDSVPMLPRRFPSSARVELGCPKEEWCHKDPCSGRGNCVDLWTNFTCDCHRPFYGLYCEKEFPVWTFSHEDTESTVVSFIHNHYGTNFEISFFLRALKQDGVVLQLSRGGDSKFTVYLKEGALRVTPLRQGPDIPVMVITKGDWWRVDMHILRDTLYLRVSGLLNWTHTLPMPVELSAEVGDIMYVGGLPVRNQTTPWGGYFKGCLQDMRLVGIDVATKFTFHPDILSAANDSDNIQPGCKSDNNCRLQADGTEQCENRGVCRVTWNDFECDCPWNFTGKRCENLVWCTTNPCSLGSHCVDLPDGYECLSNATFENSGLQYRAHGSLVVPVTNISLQLRTRQNNGVLLRASSGITFFCISLLNSSLLVKIQSGNSMVALVLPNDHLISDGNWHHVQVFMNEPQQASSLWTIAVDDVIKKSSHYATGNLNFLNDTTVYLAEDFTGCMGEVRLGGVYLPYMPAQSTPQRARFRLQGKGDIRLGCTGSPMCLSQPCQNNGTCEDLFNLFNCTCSPGWEGQYCQDNTDDCSSAPCLRGTCHDLLADFKCECPLGYGGKTCEEDLDDCQEHHCENGGLCKDGVNHYTCVCPLNFTGRFCQWAYPPLLCEQDVLCSNGGICNEGAWGANCTCRPGFTGDRCEVELNECQSDPCQHGGSCLDRASGGFQCQCVPGYVGIRCETSKQEQEESVSLLAVAVPLACSCVVLAAIGLAFGVLTTRRKRRSEGTYSPSQQEVAGARLEMDSVLKVPPEERLI